MVARVIGQAAHDAVAELEVLYSGSNGYDCASAFVGSGDWQFGAKGAMLYHAIGVAVRGYSDFDQDVFWSQVFGHGNRVDLVRLVKLGDCI